MGVKLIGRRLNRKPLNEAGFGSGLLKGLASGFADKLGVKIPDNNQQYKKAMDWFKKHAFEDSQIPGIDATVLATTKNGLRVYVVLNQNNSSTAYIRVQDIVCAFNRIKTFIPTWSDEDTAVLQDYMNMVRFYAEHEDDDKAEYDGKGKKLKPINPLSKNFDMVYNILKKYNIPMLAPKRYGIDVNPYNKAMLSGDEDVSDDKKCNVFLATYLFMSIYTVMDNLDDVLDFGKMIGAVDINTKVSEEAAGNILKKVGKDGMNSPEFKQLAEKQRMKVALSDIIRQIFNV